MREAVKWGGKAKHATHIAMADISDKIAALFVATVLTKNNATTSMEPVPVDVMTATKAETVPKFAKTIHLDQNVHLPVGTAFTRMENNAITRLVNVNMDVTLVSMVIGAIKLPVILRRHVNHPLHYMFL